MPVYNQVLGPDPAKMMEVGMNSKRTVGIDVGKAWLDVAYEGDGDVVRYPNSSAGITALLGTLDPAHDREA